MSGTMRAYRLLKAGRMPEVVEVPIPEPGPGQVRLRMAGAGLCHSDLLVIHADPPFFPLPLTMGHEATGWIDAVGPGVEGLTLGDAYGVYFSWGCGSCRACVKGAENVCERAGLTPGFATGRDGGMADYFIVDDPRHLVPLGSLDPVEAAPLMCAGITVAHAVRRTAALLEPGSVALVIGVGGLGHLAVQVLKALTPATIIAIDRLPAKLAQATDLGADHVLLSGSDSAAEIRALTDGRGAALVLDFVGNDATLGLAAGTLAQGGRLEIVGVGGGMLPIRFHTMPRDASVGTPYAGTLDDLRVAVGLAQDGAVQSDVLRVGYAELAATYARLDAGEIKGRAVLVP
ncbi:NAD(P)-dependent alcohol dehydrogenase [Niveispirillum sp. KHB5.9]|uniref:NAD(P)-dependent alcohol dehydrogenase n=1 Tax=Niveispirillum sp. KHB5.9 TaxID=3400269 RepID=UPI003A85C7E4